MGVNVDGNLVLDDLPFEQASQAQQLRAAIGLAMSIKPDLRVILLRDGALLDSDSLQAVRDLADKHDFQVWIERVGDSDECGIVIEDGEIVASRTDEIVHGR